MNKQHWIDYVSDQKPHTLLTITFRNLKKYKNPDIAVKTINNLLYLTNSSIFRKIYNRQEDSLKGFGVMEYQANEMPHFHLLLTNDICPRKLEEVIKKHLKKFHFENADISAKEQKALSTRASQGAPRWAIKAMAQHHIKKIPIMHENGLDVSPITETPERVADYLLKENSEFLLLTHDGITLPEKEKGLPQAATPYKQQPFCQQKASATDLSIYTTTGDTNMKDLARELTNKMENELEQMNQRILANVFKKKPVNDDPLHLYLMQLPKRHNLKSFSKFQKEAA